MINLFLFTFISSAIILFFVAGFFITKVEYRKVKLKQLKFDLIGYKEETKNFSYDGEIRITISPIKKDESLLKLFGEE